jgi:23S rRNA U2552 (ribose-2'-O)-methylase RlmE/FtsJ
MYTNQLRHFFEKHDGRLIDKWLHYFDIYDRHFAKFKDREVTVVEFGVSQGGSLQMWRDYFGPKARIIGIDINPNCKRFEDANTQILIGDQEDRGFLRSIAQQFPRIDVLIDDGGHTMLQQIHTYEELFPCVAADGVYLIEDLHTSYWKKWGGGLRKRGTFIEYSKNLVDLLNTWHFPPESQPVNHDFAKSVESMHFYDSVLVIEKKLRGAPVRERRGIGSFEDYEHKSPRLVDRLRRKLRGR